MADASDAPPPRSPERERLHESFVEDRHYLPQMLALDGQHRHRRVDTILSLKESIDKSASAIQSQNARRNRQQQDVEAQDAARFQELLNQGKNPYEVARKREVKATAQRERQQIEQRIQDKQIAILEHLEVEKVWRQRQEAVAAKQREYEKKYQRELGRSAVEARTQQYLVSRTGKETLDPSGKSFRQFPSQETTIPDHSFGVGRNLVHDAEQRHRIVAKVARKKVHKGVEPNPLLVPRYGQEEGSTKTSNNAAERSFSAGEGSVVPGHELQELNHSMGDDVIKTPAPPAGKRRGSSSSTTAVEGTSSKPGFGKPKRSVLEQRMLAEARERQKTNIVTKQVVWGREFTGRAFLAEPAEIWFKDYDVGVPMTLTFTLTNVSHTFNHFKLLEMDESIKELFEIQYEKPGRMSAGMACSISITFTAIQTRDIASELPALAQTGAFAIPLKCTCKKAVPLMTQTSLAFKNVVAGEKQVLSLKLENRGALPLQFRVRSVGDPLRGGQRGEQEEEEEEGVDDGPEVDEPPAVEAEVAEPESGGENVPVPTVGSSGDGADDSPPPEIAIAGEDGGEQAEDVGDEGTAASLSAVSSHASLDGSSASALASERVPLSPEERQILDFAIAATQYKPEGADRPIRFSPTGTVPPYSSTQIAFTFSPDSPMTITDAAFAIEFPAAETEYRPFFWTASLLSPLPVAISAQSTSVPIYVASPVLEMQCCLYDRLYRQQVTVCNRGSVALKLQLRVPKPLEDCVECHPNMGFVQGKSHDDGAFSIQLKFRPTASMWRRLEAKQLGSQSLGYLAVPIQVVVPDQVIPVFFVFTARIASPALSFSRQSLAFGKCTLGHSVAHTLAVTNSSRLPQRFAFVKLPGEIKLQCPDTTANLSDDGLATLLPGEVKSYRVIYQPSASATTLSARLLCRSTANDEYTVAVTGECIAWPVAFSETVVQLAATQLGQRQCHSLTCANSSDKPQTVELLAPPQAAGILAITPSVVTIAPRSSVRVEIEFLASEELFSIGTSAYEAVESDAASAIAHCVVANASREDRMLIHKQLTPVIASSTAPPPPWVGAGGVVGEDRSVHHTWTVLCFRKASETEAPVALQIHTTVVDAVLFATPKDLEFGQVAIGQTLVKDLVLTNDSPQNVLLKAKAVHALGGFRLINSLQRTLQAHGGQRVVKVEFQPTAPLLYDEELELSSPELGVLRVALRGEGVNPSLKIQPENGLIDFKDVLARNRSVSEFQLTNASAFPLTFSIVAIGGDPGPVTSAGLPAFTFTPSHATIPAQATMAVKLLFFPDHQRPQHYRQQFLIQVPNESERHVLTVTGRCWENQVYVFNPHEAPKLFAVPSVEDVFDVPPSINLASLLGGAGQGVFSLALAAPGIKKAPSPLTVVFDGDATEPQSKAIYVGATQPPSTAVEDENAAHKPSNAAAGTFEFAIEENPEKPHYAKMFTLEPMKGTITVGQQLSIQMSYTPPPAASASGDGSEGAVREELLVSQWIQVRVTCTLKGGALWRHIPIQSPPAASAPTGKAAAPPAAAGSDAETRTVHLALRAKLQL